MVFWNLGFIGGEDLYKLAPSFWCAGDFFSVLPIQTKWTILFFRQTYKQPNKINPTCVYTEGMSILIIHIILNVVYGAEHLQYGDFKISDAPWKSSIE